jgi:hypothetical protein
MRVAICGVCECGEMHRKNKVDQLQEGRQRDRRMVPAAGRW